MVDFKKLRTSSSSQGPIDPTEIFLRLATDGQINDLYTSHSEVLKEWFKRRNERDLVIKLHTGGGKTLVGLLIAQSVLNERKEPVVYLCPTNQLVRQTIQKAHEYGITAVEASAAGGFDAAF
jgi:replicative superfamily II helicase